MWYLVCDKNSDIWNAPNTLIRNLIWLPQSAGVSGTNNLLLTVWMCKKSVTNFPFQKEVLTYLIAFPEKEQRNTLWLRNGCKPTISTLR